MGVFAVFRCVVSGKCVGGASGWFVSWAVGVF